MKQDPPPTSIEQGPPSQSSPAPAAKTGNVFSKHLIWWLSLLILCLVFSIVFPNRANEGDILWANILGSVLGMFAAGFILTGILFAISLVARKRMTSKQFMSTFTVVITLAGIARIVVTTTEKQAIAKMERDHDQVLRSLELFDTSLESSQSASGYVQITKIKGRARNKSSKRVSAIFVKISIFNPHKTLIDTKPVGLRDLNLAPGDVTTFSGQIDIDRVPNGFSWTYAITEAIHE